MDKFDISDAKEPPRTKRSSAMVWNVLTILMLVIALCAAAVFLLILINPDSSLNPFPPPTLMPLPDMPTATITYTPRITLQPSWTPTITMPPMTNTPAPTHTPFLTETPYGVAGTPTIAATLTPGGFSFVLQQGSPAAITGTAFHPEAGCNWAGVAGQATSLNGEAVRGLFVQLGGSIPGDPNVDKLTMSGLAPQYGPGGFEFTIANNLVASNHTLWIQLQDQQNLPLSDRVYFDTFDDCQKNLIIIYFVQVR
jgi:hypothetical protein